MATEMRYLGGDIELIKRARAKAKFQLDILNNGTYSDKQPKIEELEEAIACCNVLIGLHNG